MVLYGCYRDALEYTVRDTGKKLGGKRCPSIAMNAGCCAGMSLDGIILVKPQKVIANCEILFVTCYSSRSSA